MDNNRQLYIVVSQSGTIVSRMLKLFTRAEYNHVSISLTPDLEQMYSFARLKTYLPFPGGLIRESPDYGVFKRFEETKVVIIAVDVNEDKYKEVCECINDMYSQKSVYKYNYIGVLMAPFKKIVKRDNHFYCSEFVRYILQKGNVEGVEKLPCIIYPMDFFELPHQKLYSGIFKEYDNKICEYM